MKLGFGKHGDDELEDVPEKYLQWLINSSQEKIDMCQGELRRRTTRVDNSTMAQIVKEGTQLLLNNTSDPDKQTVIRTARDTLMAAIIDAAGESK